MSTTQSKRALPLRSDLLVLGSLGLCALAWLARRYTTRTSTPEQDTAAKESQDTESVDPVAKEPENDKQDFVSVMKKQGHRVIFFYGSQTGTAEDYAHRLADQCAENYGIHGMVVDLDTYSPRYLDAVPNDALVVFVVATYGEGEPTDNAVEFCRFLTNEPRFSKGEQPEELPLRNLRYLVFGLGNKTYEHYNQVGRLLDKVLSGLGGTRIGERGEGDDNESMEDAFISWQATMWPSFCDALGVEDKVRDI